MFEWQKIGRIIQPDPQTEWMATFTGPSFAQVIPNTDLVDIYITGRDTQNRSQIGRIRINMNDPLRILEKTIEPVFSVGELGTFDENGVSYPWLISHKGNTYLYYVGWMPTVLTPFNIQLGLAIQQADGTFKRYSKAPILPRNKEDYLGFGSVCVLLDEGIWKMWYTSLVKWGKTPSEHKHYYHIKYATSEDGINWHRNNDICITFADESEYAICRPSVWKDANGSYHLWFTVRGDQYRIVYAISTDGIHWRREEAQTGITLSETGWDDRAICYAHVFPFKGHLYMLYNGNDYGKTGLGIAKVETIDMEDVGIGGLWGIV